jgi:transcriptional regulator with XRE-family HTH domain
MPTTLADVMADLSPEERAEVERGAAEILVQNKTVSELRKQLKITQVDLAKALATSQANIAQIEKKKDLMVSTVTRVVEALGGSLQLVVKIPGHAPAALKIGASKGEPVIKKPAIRRRKTVWGAATAAGRREHRKRA